jgi:allophanate hydrolase
MKHVGSLDIATLRAAYAGGALTPLDVIDAVLRRTAEDPDHVWITRLSPDAVRAYVHALKDKNPASLPLYGIPFAIKDNIDLGCVPTTAACREFAYTPSAHAFVVERLIEAGAIPIGKTNLDQFATGLNGTRSPWGACRNAFDPMYVSGGSSSGSAVAVAKGFVSFSLGTDTAGSGRVPAAFNNLVGHKPTLGWLSTTGVVPACRSLDTVSIFALTAEDAEAVTTVASVFDVADGFSRQREGHGFDFGNASAFRVGVPRTSQLAFFGNVEAARLFVETTTRLRALGAECIEVDLQPFLDTAKFLYEGPWVAERHAAIRDFLESHPDAPLPVIREIIGGAHKWSASDAFAWSYRLKAAKRQCDAMWQKVDLIVTPTAGTIYTIEDMLADPVRLNSNLGYYTNFMNLLDYAATAVPAGFQPDGLPFGVTLFAPAHQDAPLLRLAAKMQRSLGARLGATDAPLPAMQSHPMLPGGQVRVAVCGAHLSGLPLNWQLTSRGARLVAKVKSAAEYRFVVLPGGPLLRPGMVRVGEGGGAIEMEIWEMPSREFGSFVAGISAPLGIGTVGLEDGSKVQGFVCEALAAEGAEDITPLGDWRLYLAAKAAAAQ